MPRTFGPRPRDAAHRPHRDKEDTGPAPRNPVPTITAAAPQRRLDHGLATGAATWPPVASSARFPPFSTTTATAIWGCSAGAKHVNHACGAPTGVRAVPVLPPTVMPGICAAVPVWATSTGSGGCAGPTTRGSRPEAPDEILRYCVEKGSITVEGVSLTIAALAEGSFGVALIPHTREVTTLGAAAEGDELNLEVDVIAKHVERLVRTE